MTSAEIKVVLVKRCWTGLYRRARSVFAKLGLERTAGRNCVLILVSLADREFLVHADEGIDHEVGAGFWDALCDEMAERFARDGLADGLCLGVQLVAERLAPLFPHRDGDEDEVSNEVLYEP